MYYIKKQVSFIKSGLHLDYMEPHYTTRNIVIVSFYFSAVFFSSSP